VRDAQGNDTS